MNRHQRRKRSRVRKEANASLLLVRALARKKEELKRLRMDAPERKRLLKSGKLTAREAAILERRSQSSGCLGNRGLYQGFGLYTAPGYGTGAFKDKPLSERALRELRAK